MSLERTSEQQELYDATLEFARERLARDVEALDAADGFDRASWKAAAEFGRAAGRAALETVSPASSD